MSCRPRPVMPSSPSVSPQALSSSKVILGDPPIVSVAMASQQTSPGLSNFKQQCLLTLSMWVRNVDKHSALHMVSCSEVEGAGPHVETMPQEREAAQPRTSASSPVRCTEVGHISQLPLEIHRPGRHFTDVTPSAEQTGHSGTTLLGWDRTGWGQGLSQGGLRVSWRGLGPPRPWRYPRWRGMTGGSRQGRKWILVMKGPLLLVDQQFLLTRRPASGRG